MSERFYRVVPKQDWCKALQSGYVPRCPADVRKNRIHLNRLRDVELVANLWFSPEEEPIVLELDIGHLEEALKWEQRDQAPYGIWPNLYVNAIPVSHVKRIFALEYTTTDGTDSAFKLGNEIDYL